MKGRATPQDLIARFGPQALILLATAAIYMVFASQPLIHDVAWLLEASRRWLAGARLYSDIVEVNPPLAIYEIVALSAGQLSATSYVAGVCAVIAISTAWVNRLQDPFLAMASFVAMVIGGMTDFGQRDHLALLFIIPFLLGDNAGRTERISLGLWAFLGVGLKPYFLAIPLAAIIARAILARSLAPIFAIENWALGIACVAYLVGVVLLHPNYLTEMVPLANFVYWAYQGANKPVIWVLTSIIIAICLLTIKSGDSRRIPLAAATLAALSCYYLQGRNWTYHFVPAAGLAVLLSIWTMRDAKKQTLLCALSLLLVIAQLSRGFHQRRPQSPIPAGITSVAFLTAHVWGAYPTSLACNVRNTSRYPALWTLPGAWNLALDSDAPVDVRKKAADLLKQERSTIVDDIMTERPQLIFADRRQNKPYFQRPFDYMSFLQAGGLTGYVPAGKVWMYDIWRRTDVAPTVIERPLCTEH